MIPPLFLHKIQFCHICHRYPHTVREHKFIGIAVKYPHHTDLIHILTARLLLIGNEVGYANLNRLLDRLDEQWSISVTYFIPDEKKSGGKYVDKVGVVRIYDSYANELVFTDGVRIAVADMARLDFTEELQ